MLFLTGTEKSHWAALGEEILAKQSLPDTFSGDVRANLLPAFCFYAGALLSSHGHGKEGLEWFAAGARDEDKGFFSNAIMTSFLARNDNRFEMPTVVFSDPRPYVHFTTIPTIMEARAAFARQCGCSLPKMTHPLRIMDIGCGNGGMLVLLLQHLQKVGKVGDIGEILLIDPSPAMLELAVKTVGEVYPPSLIKTANCRIEALSDTLRDKYDVALAALSYHHMPWDKKLFHLERLRPYFDHFMIFELDANNDLPALHTPELALSVYQSYGSMIDFIFAHDAPVEVALACVDCFLMTEEVSLLTQERGVRNDYHMLRNQWHEAFQTGLGKDFACLCDSICFGDDHMNLFTMHYGR